MLIRPLTLEMRNKKFIYQCWLLVLMLAMICRISVLSAEPGRPPPAECCDGDVQVVLPAARHTGPVMLIWSDVWWSNYEEKKNSSVDGNICVVPHILFQGTTVFDLHIRVSVEIRPCQWMFRVDISPVLTVMVEKIPWTAAPSSTSIWEQILEFRSGKYNIDYSGLIFYSL